MSLSHKRRPVAGRFRAVIIAIITVVAPVSAATGQSDYHRFFYDEQLPLPIDASRIAVFQDRAGDPPPLAPILVAHGIDPGTIELFGRPGWTFVDTPAWVRDGSDVETLVAALADEDGLDFITPVFFDAEGDPLCATTDILVRFRLGVPAEAQRAIIDASGAGIVLDQRWAGMGRAWRLLSGSKNGFVALDATNALAELDSTRWAEPDLQTMGERHDLPNDPYFAECWRDLNYSDNPAFDPTSTAQDFDMDTAEAWTFTTGDPDLRIAIIDRGTQLDHPDLNAEAGADIYQYYPLITGTGAPQNSCDNHGTKVAGVVTARNDNGIGVVGVAPDCVSVAVRNGASNCDGTVASSIGVVVMAVAFAVADGCRITVNSWGMTSSAAVQDIYQNTRAAGILHFFSTGNDGLSSIQFPASIPDVIAVGATAPDGTIADYSHTGAHIDLVAPGSFIWTTDRTGSDGSDSGDYVRTFGTSLACPAAAGVAALVWSAQPFLTADEVEAILRDTATDLGAEGYDTTFGYGQVNAQRAVMSANGWLDDDSPLILTEIRTADPGSPDTEEYFELYNTSESSVNLSDLAYLVIGDDNLTGTNDGVLDEAIKLSGFESVAGYRFHTVAESTFTLGSFDEERDLAFENDDTVTHMLVSHCREEAGCDLDVNDDGVLDYEPWLQVLDSVAILAESGSEPLTSEWWYADGVEPDGLGDARSHIYRCNTVEQWTSGPADPADGEDTPDENNELCFPEYGGMSFGPVQSTWDISGPGPDLRVTRSGPAQIPFGVIFATEQAEFLCVELGDFTPASMPLGAKLTGRSSGTIDGDPGREITVLEVANTEDGLAFTARFPDAGPTSGVTLLNDGEVVAEYAGLESPIVIVSGPIEGPPILEFIPKPDELPGPLPVGGTVSFGADVEVIVTGPSVTADQIVFRPSDPVTFDHLENVSLIARGTPTFTISALFVGKFGNAHRSFGEARFGLGPDTLSIEPLSDPGGADGVTIETGAAESATIDFDALPEPSSLPAGAFLWADATGSLGEDGADIGRVRFMADGASRLAISANFSALGAQQAEALFYDDAGNLVAHRVLDGWPALIARTPAWMQSMERAAQPMPAVSLTWPGEVPITPAGDQDPIMVHRVDVQPVGGAPIESVRRLGLHAGRGLSAFVIAGENVVAVDRGAPCSSDLDGDGEVGFGDLIDVLAAWGACPPGDCPEDFDDDGEVGFSDLVQVLADWGPCPF